MMFSGYLFKFQLLYLVEIICDDFPFGEQERINITVQHGATDELVAFGGWPRKEMFTGDKGLKLRLEQLGFRFQIDKMQLF